MPAEAAEVCRTVPPSGNLWIAGQQIWLGPALSGRTVQVWAGRAQVHVLLDGYRIKTLPSRLDRTDIGRLLASGARPADCRRYRRQPARFSSWNARSPHPVNVSLTLRLDAPVAHVITGGVLTRTVACPVPEQARNRLRGARPGRAARLQLPEPQIVRRRVSARGAIMIGEQRIQVGLPHAAKTAEITIEPDTYQISVDDGPAITAARTSSRDIRRTKPPTTPPGSH